MKSKMNKNIRRSIRVLICVLLSAAQIFAAGIAEAASYPTVYNGVNLSAVYDYNYYMKRYPYLKKKYANDPKGALLYFGRNGIRTGQKAKASYSQKTYDALYKKTHPFPAADPILRKIGWSLRSAFDYAHKIPSYHGSELGEYGTPWNKTSKWYFNFGKDKGKGNCYVKAGTFVILAKEIGYKVVQIGGYVPYRSGKLGPHSWVEITRNGKTLVCDPASNQHMFAYGTRGTYKYQNKHTVTVAR